MHRGGRGRGTYRPLDVRSRRRWKPRSGVLRVVVALIGHSDHSGSFDVEGKLFPLCAFLYRLVSFKGCGLFCTHGLSLDLEDRCRVL
jgi:hypothetical protein